MGLLATDRLTTATTTPNPQASPSSPPSAAAVAGRLWRVLDPPPFLLAGACLFLVAAAVAELAVPALTSATIEAATSGPGKVAAITGLFGRKASAAAAASAAASASAEAALRTAVTRLACVAFMYGSCAAARGGLFTLLNTQLVHNLRTQLFGALVAAPSDFFDSGDAAGAATRLGADCAAVARCLSTNLNVAARNLLAVVGGAAYLCAASQEAATACAGVGAVLAAVAVLYGAYSRAAARAYQDRLADAGGVAEQALGRASTVRALGGESAEAARYGHALNRLRRVANRQAAAYFAVIAANASAYNLAKAVALAAAGGAALRGGLSAPALTAVLLYVDATASALLSLCDQFGAVMEALGAAERVVAYLDAPPAPQLARTGVAPPGRHILSVVLENVSYTYPSRPGVQALAGVSLRLDAGRRVALVGGSGSGKSTLVQLVLRLRDPDGGRVMVGGMDATAIDAAWLRGRVALVEQEPRLFADTVAANIAYGLEVVSEGESRGGAAAFSTAAASSTIPPPRTTRAAIIAAAVAANAHAFISALPSGYDTPVTDRLLSGGQRQRIALARALVRDPDLLVLDEATAALDAESEAAVQAGLDAAAAARPRCTLIIAHRLSTVRTADEIVVMEAGRVAERGTHAGLLATPGSAYAALVARQAGAGGLGGVVDLAPHESRRGTGEGGEDGGASPSSSSSSSPLPEEGPDAMMDGAGGRESGEGGLAPSGPLDTQRER